MKFVEWLRPEKKRDPLDNLHPSFKLEDKNWRFNKEIGLAEGKFTLKARVAFDDPELLDNCPFYAKVGNNSDESINRKYVGFIYGDRQNRSELTEWIKKFPYCELITGLDHDAVSTQDSRVSVINPDAEQTERRQAA